MKPIQMLVAFAVILGLCIPALRAQDQQSTKQNSGPASPDSPLPPMAANPNVQPGQTPASSARGVSSGSDSQPYDPAQVEPDTHLLSGTELFSVGSLGKPHTIFDPSLYVSATGTSAPFFGPTQTAVMSSIVFGGTLNVDQRWGISRLIASYNGAYNINHPNYVVNTNYHDLSIEDEISWARLRFRIRDDLQVSPFAFFGGQGIGGPGLVGQFNPSQTLQSVTSTVTSETTIQTGEQTRLMNNTLGEVDYSLSRRSAFSLSGSYGLLHFTGPGFIDSRSLYAQGGYNYMVDPKDSVAVIGAYDKTAFVGFPNSNDAYSGELAYGRNITGKVALQVAVGPEQIQVSDPGSSNFQFLSWSANAAISFHHPRTNYSLNYTHALSNGGGVILGALSHTFSAGISHSFTRYWSGSASSGYAWSSSLTLPTAPISYSFTNWFAGAYIGRRLSYRMNISFNYGVTYSGTSSTCPVNVCGFGGYFHTFGTTVNWHLRRVG
jgi:hypothetical protein